MKFNLNVVQASALLRSFEATLIVSLPRAWEQAVVVKVVTTVPAGASAATSLPY